MIQPRTMKSHAEAGGTHFEVAMSDQKFDGRAHFGARKALLGWLVGAVALVALSSGCKREEGNTFFIAFNQALQDDCALLAGGGQVAVRPKGRLDLAITNEYKMFVAVTNSMPSSLQASGETPATLMSENNNIQINGATLRYKIGDVGVDLPQDQFVFTSGTVAPTGSSLVEIGAIPPIVGEILRAAPHFQTKFASAEVVVLVTLSGTLQDGTKVRSREFVYPIEVCNGCLVQYSVSPEFCCDPQTWGSLEFPCFPGQDDGLDCRACCATAIGDAAKAACLP